jgi:DNA replication licensing factor MCM7
VGNIPRSLTVTCRGELTRLCGPGEMVTVCGVFLPKRYTGFRGMQAGLIADTYLEASDVVRQKESYANLVADAAMEARLDEAAEQPDVFSKLARCLFGGAAR